MAWVREHYRDMFADNGSLPVPGEICDGAMINHPDVDLADPTWNTSRVPWHTLYFENNYLELQRLKRRGIRAMCSITPSLSVLEGTDHQSAEHSFRRGAEDFGDAIERVIRRDERRRQHEHVAAHSAE